MQRIENLHMLKLASNLFYVEPISFALALRWLVFFWGGGEISFVAKNFDDWRKLEKLNIFYGGRVFSFWEANALNIFWFCITLH